MAGNVFGGERVVAGEIVVEAVLDRRPDGHLGAGVKRLHGLRQHVGGVVADHAQGGRVAAGDEPDGGVVLHRAGQVGQLAVHFHSEGGAGQAGADGGGDLGAGHRAVERADGAVGQGDWQAWRQLSRERGRFNGPRPPRLQPSPSAGLPGPARAAPSRCPPLARGDG